MSDLRLNSVEDFIKGVGIQPRRLKNSQVVHIQEGWRRSYSQAVMEKTGGWGHLNFDDLLLAWMPCCRSEELSATEGMLTLKVC